MLCLRNIAVACAAQEMVTHFVIKMPRYNRSARGLSVRLMVVAMVLRCVSNFGQLVLCDGYFDLLFRQVSVLSVCNAPRLDAPTWY